MPKSLYTGAYRRFIKKLVSARTSAGVTQVELAAKVGWSQSDISKVERSERRLDVAEFLQFAQALKIDAAAFIRELQSNR